MVFHERLERRVFHFCLDDRHVVRPRQLLQVALEPWGPPVGQLDIHDVWVMDNEDALDKCDFRRATELQVAIQRADVEVTGEAGQTRYFSCSIGEHCRDGQVLTVEWVNATAAPTPARKNDNSDGATQRAFVVGFLMTYFVVDIFV